MIIKRDEAPTQTASGLLVIPDTAQDWRGEQGTVLAIGPKVHTVKVGDRVLLPALGGIEVRDAGVLVGIWPEDDIFGVIDHAA